MIISLSIANIITIHLVFSFLLFIFFINITQGYIILFLSIPTNFKFQRNLDDIKIGLSGNLIDGLPYIFCIRAGFNTEPIRILFIDGILVGIDSDTNGLIELMHFTQVKRLV